MHLALGEPGLGEGRALRSAAAGGGRAPPLSRGSSRSAGVGPGAPRCLPGLSSAFARVVLCVDEAGSRGPGFRGFTHTPLALPRASSAPRAGPSLRHYKLVPLLCWVLLELVPLTPRFCLVPPPLRFWFSGREEGVFFLQLAPGFLPPRRAWVPPLAGSGAGRTRVAVHVVGVRRFPRLQGQRPSPSP